MDLYPEDSFENSNMENMFTNVDFYLQMDGKFYKQL